MHTNITSGPLFNWTQAIYALHAFSLLTGILGTATVVGAFLTGWPSLIVSVWLLGGLTLLSVGMIGIYLSRVFVEVKRRPYTIVRDLYRRDRGP